MAKLLLRSALAAATFLVVVALVAGIVLVVADYLRLRAEVRASYQFLAAPVESGLKAAEREALEAYRKGKAIPRAEALDLIMRESSAGGAK